MLAKAYVVQLKRYAYSDRDKTGAICWIGEDFDVAHAFPTFPKAWQCMHKLIRTERERQPPFSIMPAISISIQLYQKSIHEIFAAMLNGDLTRELFSHSELIERHEFDYPGKVVEKTEETHGTSL